MPQPAAFYLEHCPFSKGDPVSKVKEFYGITFDPLRREPPYPGGYVYQYHFIEYGVWIFFDSELLVNLLHLTSPFEGTLGGFSIGAYKDDIRRVKGQPDREMEGIVDSDAEKEREQRKQDILAALPDPAPKEQVMRAFSDIAQLNALPINSTAWIYNPEVPSFVRFDIGAISGRVQHMFSRVGTGDSLVRRAYREAGRTLAWYECYRKLTAQIMDFDEALSEVEELIAISLPPFEKATIESENSDWQSTTSSLASLINVAYILLGGHNAEQIRFGNAESEAQSNLLRLVIDLHRRYIEELIGNANAGFQEAVERSWQHLRTSVDRYLHDHWSVVEMLAARLLKEHVLTKPEVFDIVEQ